MIIKYFIRLCQRKKLKFDRKLKSFLNDEMIQELHDFEEKAFYEYNHASQIARKEKMEERVHNTSNKVENINTRIDDIFAKENLTKLSLYKVESRLQKLEEFTFEILDQIQQLAIQLKPKSLNHSLDNNKDENSLKEEQTLNEAKYSTSASKSRPFLRRRMLSESNANEINDESKNLQLSNSFRKKTSSETKTLNKSMTKIDDKGDKDLSQTGLHTLVPVGDDILNELIMKSEKNDDHENVSKSIDQYTLHPFVYLQPVVKPPLNEYTSITDCIDTTEFDRAPSPPPSFLFQKDNTHSFLSSKEANEYCAAETVRSTIARQESEMLILAEESEHVIYTQMLNKMVRNPTKKKKLLKSSKVDAVEDNKSSINTINEEDKTIEPDLAKPYNDEVFSLELSEDKSIENDQVEDDQLTPLDSKNHHDRNNNLEKAKNLLNENHRNSSQIWFVQSEADVLCLELDEDENTNC